MTKHVLVALALVMTVPVAGEAQNTVFNGSFATGLEGWQLFDRVVAWAPSDAADSPRSGSARLVNTSPTANNAHGMDQCLAGAEVVPGALYDFGGRIWIPSGQATTGWGAVGLRWYDGPACTGDTLTQPRAQTETIGAGYVLVSSTGNPAPAGAVSVEFTTYATKAVDGGVFQVWVDDLYFGPTGTVAAPPPRCVLAAAHLAGAADTDWRTDLEAHNPTDATASFAVDLLVRDAANPVPARTTHTVAARSSLRLDDVLMASFGFDGAAALRLWPGNDQLRFSSRTFNQVTLGTYGQQIPALHETETIRHGGEGRLIQLRHDPAAATGYRTNLGLVNAVAMDIVVEVDLYRSDGVLLGTVQVELAPFEVRQLNRVFEQVSAAAVDDGYAVVRTTTPLARFFAYASVIDNATGDAVCFVAS